MHRRGFLGLAVAAIGAAALTEGCVTISPLATTGDFPVNSALNLAQSQTWIRMKQRNNDAGQIVIGVKADQPGLGFFDPSKNSYSGFDILIAQLVAAGLGFSSSQIQFTPVASQNRETELENGTVDLVIASYSYNSARAKLVDFAGPYFTTPEALLVARGNTSITALDSITSNTRVCEVSNSTQIGDVTLQSPVTKNTYGECVSALKSDQADVIYTDYALLLGYAYQNSSSLKLIDTHADTQYYGIGLPLGDSVLQTTIDNLLSQAIANGTWRAIFNSTLAPEGLKANPPKVGDWPSSSS
ncbi:transporter substrate-binding domain-containing protein [Actinospica sp.]|jgi:glutamate transport system substrate-binding protein|uniref:transporter substrate-binding domain-containing protein n=1 Tax=Actinospica sp. TaxID=1872142 RepID=UPI002B6C80D7|nr:transporter substrate-binding domain-containing protein [Actinospica sp.]HWG26881.1 transporter substrate-binding domain-containing protein [Actinospica sp.]